MLAPDLRLLLRRANFGLCVVLSLFVHARAAGATTTISGGSVGNQSWTVAGSPYVITGDISVPAATTLTIDAGVAVQVASTDVLAAGADAVRVEITVSGTLTVNGTAANPVTFKAQAGGGANVWYGIVFTPTALTSSISFADIQNANAAIRSSATGTNLAVSRSSISNSTTGVSVLDGTPSLDQLTITGGTNGVSYLLSGGGSLTRSTILSATNGVNASVSSSSTINITNTVVRSCTTRGVYANASGGATLTLNITNATLHANGSYGVDTNAGTTSTTTVNITNAIVTSHTTGGISRSTTGGGAVAINTIYSDVWNNTSNYVGTSAAAGCISQNPLYVAAPNDLALQSTSGCIDSGTSAGAPSTDLLGTARPFDGDGINGAQYDMGAYESTTVTCGDSIVQPGEACDDGAFNGQYGHCKADCSGAGLHCGDGAPGGTEECDDGNVVDTDACRNSCVAAKCGDGVVQAGVEECDDSNSDNTDACLSVCKAATCGDGFVRVGVEQCDDGNGLSGDGCSPTCTVENVGLDAGADSGVDAGPSSSAGGADDAGVPIENVDAGPPTGNADASAPTETGDDAGGQTITPARTDGGTNTTGDASTDTTASDHDGCSVHAIGDAGEHRAGWLVVAIAALFVRRCRRRAGSS